jgi:hypothetical protein
VDSHLHKPTLLWSLALTPLCMSVCVCCWLGVGGVGGDEGEWQCTAQPTLLHRRHEGNTTHNTKPFHSQQDTHAPSLDHRTRALLSVTSQPCLSLAKPCLTPFSFPLCSQACVAANQGERGAQLFQDMRRELKVRPTSFLGLLSGLPFLGHCKVQHKQTRHYTTQSQPPLPPPSSR